MDTRNGIATEPTYDRIERGADWVLDRFADLGASYDSFRGNTTDYISKGSSIASAPAEVQQGLHLRELASLKNQHGIPNGIAEKFNISPFQPGWLTKTIAWGGATVNSLTGVLDMASEFNRERSAGSRQYPNTMRSAFTSVAQISGGSALGVAAGAGVAAISSTVAVPILIGAAVGTGAAYGIGKISSWLR